jgi:hypothetical protein
MEHVRAGHWFFDGFELKPIGQARQRRDGGWVVVADVTETGKAVTDVVYSIEEAIRWISDFYGAEVTSVSPKRIDFAR